MTTTEIETGATKRNDRTAEERGTSTTTTTTTTAVAAAAATLLPKATTIFGSTIKPS